MKETVYTCLGFAVGIITNALFSSNIRKSAKAIISSLCYVAGIASFIFLSWPNVGDGEEQGFFSILINNFWVVIAIMIFCIVITLHLIYGTATVNRRKISKILVGATKEASREHPLRLIAGDLDFLGDITKGDIKGFRLFLLRISCFVPILNNYTYPILNKYTHHNEQWKQLINKEFSKIEIICREPAKPKDFLMIGSLKNTFPDIKIKFYGKPDLKCIKCSNKNICEICDICESCTRKNCNQKKSPCIKLLNTKIQLCRFQDLDIRGRLFKNRENALRVDIFTKTQSEHKYVNNLFTANDCEASFYDKLWETWWNSCREESKILEKCLQKYTDYVSG